MTDASSRARALRPLWMLATGSTIGALASALTTVQPPSWLPPMMLVVGLTAAGLALRWRRRGRSTELWLLAGLALVCGRGLFEVGGNLQLQRLIVDGRRDMQSILQRQRLDC